MTSPDNLLPDGPFFVHTDTFGDKCRALAEKGILRILSDGAWVQPNYAGRIQLPKELMEEVWGMVDKKALKKKLVGRIEQELADRIVNAIAAELATDIKQILSVPERREAIRSLAREHMTSIMEGKK